MTEPDVIAAIVANARRLEAIERKLDALITERSIAIRGVMAIGTVVAIVGGWVVTWLASARGH